MSNYDLQSKLNQLQGELRQAERVNAELRGELSTVEQGVNRAHRDLEDYNDKIRGTLDNCNGTMTSSHQRVIDAIEVQGEIERMYVRFKQMELANKKIRAANNKKYYDFANYRTVRKIVQGMMDNLDVTIVTVKPKQKTAMLLTNWVTAISVGIRSDVWRHAALTLHLLTKRIIPTLSSLCLGIHFEMRNAVSVFSSLSVLAAASFTG